MAIRLFKSQLENWHEMDFCDPQFDFEAKVKSQKERNASEAAANRKLMSEEKVLLVFASSLLPPPLSYSLLTYLESDTKISTSRKQSLIYNSTLLPPPYIIHVVFSLKSASPCLYGIQNPPRCSRGLANAVANRLA